MGSFHFRFISVFRWQFTVRTAACLAQLIQPQLKRISREFLSCSFTDGAAEGLGSPRLHLFLCPVYSRSQQLGRDGGMKQGGCNGCSREVSGVNASSSIFYSVQQLTDTSPASAWSQEPSKVLCRPTDEYMGSVPWGDLGAWSTSGCQQTPLSQPVHLEGPWSW